MKASKVIVIVSSVVLSLSAMTFEEVCDYRINDAKANKERLALILPVDVNTTNARFNELWVSKSNLEIVLGNCSNIYSNTQYTNMKKDLTQIDSELDSKYSDNKSPFIK